MTRVQLADITLNVEQSGTGPALLLLHGFTGSAAAWHNHIARLAPHFRTIAPDLIGHGYSDAPSDPDRYTVERCGIDLLALLDALEVERAAVLGYSMGGRVALRLAATAPERVCALILESSSPGLTDAAEQRARVTADEALAEAIDRDGLVAFIDRWERLPLFSSQAALPEETRARLRAQRLQNNPRGLANSLRGMGVGRQTPLWDRLALVDMPTLLITGELDPKYCAIAQQMVAALPNAALASVPNAGHTVHLEQSQAFTEHVLGFLQRTDTGF